MTDFDFPTFDGYLSEIEQSKVKITKNWLPGDEWSGGTLPEIIKLARLGWPEGKKHMERFSAKITDRVQASLPQQSQFWDTSGLDFDMGMAINGEPECWYDFAPKEEMKFIRIGVNGFFSAGVGNEVITMRGGAICALVDALEMMNYRVELDVIQAASDNGGYASRVRIKNFSDALDIDRLAFVTTHRAMFRVLAAQHVSAKLGPVSWFCDKNHEWFKGYDIYFPPLVGMPEEFANFNKCEQHILDLLKKQGIDIQTKVQGD